MSSLIACFLTQRRRFISAAIALIVLIASSLSVVHYIDHQCSHLGLGLLAVLSWVVMIAGGWWVFVMALSPQVILPSLLRDWILEQSGGFTVTEAEAEERLKALGVELPQLQVSDARQFKVNAAFRFRLYFFFGVLGCMLTTHLTHHQFLTRFQKIGIPLIQLRSDDSSVRLSGLNRIVESGQYHFINEDRWGRRSVAPPLARAVLYALNDPHEGVQARAAFVSGLLGLEDAVAPLTALAISHESLREVALLALGSMPVPKVSTPPAAAAVRELARREEIRRSNPLAVAIAVGQQRLSLTEELMEIYQRHSADTSQLKPTDTKRDTALSNHEAQRAREASIWALGELRDSALLTEISSALKDSALSVRCLATLSLEKMVVFESSEALREAFSHAQIDEICPQIVAPHQEGVKPLILMPKMSYQLAIMRAIATTDDPELFQWMYEQDQRELNKKAKVLMRKYHKKLTKLDQSGKLREHKRKLRRRAQREANAKKSHPISPTKTP